MTLRVACIQLNSGNDIAENISAIEKWVGAAAKKGAEFVTLPENAFYMRAHGQTEPCPLYTQEDHPGVKAAAVLAKKYAVWLLVGSMAAKKPGNKKTYNRSILFNAQGKIVANYDKIHLFDAKLPNGEHYGESDRFLPGGKLAIAKTPWGTLGMAVCYDVRFPHLFRALAKKGASIITLPSAFTQTTGEAHWHVLLRARAIETGCFIIAPAQTGTHHGGRKTYGHSLVVDPWGKVLADGGTKEGVVLADIDLSEVDAVRGRLPSLKHDRKFE